VLPYDLFAILLYNERRRDLRIRYGVGHREDVVRDLALTLGQGITGTAAARGEPLLVGDVRNDPRYLNTVDAVRTEMAAPMTARASWWASSTCNPRAPTPTRNTTARCCA